MRESGLYTEDEIRPINELRMRARWKLGQLLAKIERNHGPGRGKKISRTEKSFMTYISDLGLDKSRALEAQRIGHLPEKELEKALAAAHKADRLSTVSDLIISARPWWYKASREKKHKIIHATAATISRPAAPGPFPLLYPDPPWKFATFSEKGLERTPDQKYPTLTDEEIINYKVFGKTVPEIAHRDAALLMWCTSSNIHRALSIMDAWGFSYKSQAIWAHTRKDGALWPGMGLVFRNIHDVLLYGTRGNMPGPQYQPPSVFLLPRGEHSAKPPEFRQEIERMYPDFDATTRLEMFARG
jgi:N6-adenosine-specific RNA methylase IME4